MSCRRSLVAIVGVVLAISGIAQGGEKRTVVLIGDSIRMSYQKFVTQNVSESTDVWAPKENCSGSDKVLEKVEGWLEGKAPAVIYINCGLHDIYLYKPGTCKRSVDAYGKNLEAIFKKLRTTCKNAKIIFALTTPVDEEKQKTSKTYGRLVRRNSDVTKYNEKALEIAKAQEIQTDNLHTVLSQIPADEQHVADGIHLSVAARMALGKHVAATINKALGK